MKGVSKEAYRRLATHYRTEAWAIRGVERPNALQKERWAKMMEDAARDYELTAEGMTDAEDTAKRPAVS